MLMLIRVSYVIDSCLKPLLFMYEEIVFCWWLPILGQGMRRYSILFTNNNYYWWETWLRNKDSFMHWLHVQGATTTRDDNLWRAKIWRLSFFHYPPEFKTFSIREKGGAHFMQAWCQNDLPTLYQRRTGRQTDVIWTLPETIWIIVDKTAYKDPAPKTLDELRQWLRFAWKNATLDTLWELLHSIPHSLENVRKHTRRHSAY